MEVVRGFKIHQKLEDRDLQQHWFKFVAAEQNKSREAGIGFCGA
jgi:hypothetical protein